jgi:hypothetical protein
MPHSTLVFRPQPGQSREDFRARLGSTVNAIPTGIHKAGTSYSGLPSEPGSELNAPIRLRSPCAPEGAPYDAMAFHRLADVPLQDVPAPCGHDGHFLLRWE